MQPEGPRWEAPSVRNGGTRLRLGNDGTTFEPHDPLARSPEIGNGRVMRLAR